MQPQLPKHQQMICNGILRLCCADKKNLKYEGFDSVHGNALWRCVCGRVHHVMVAEPGRLTGRM